MRLLSHIFSLIFSVCICIIIFACTDDGKPSLRGVFDHEDSSEAFFDLNDIQAEGEIIILTLYGPDTYFEFRGEDFGNQFKLAQRYARDIGVSARVYVCRTQREMLEKLQAGEGDLIAYDMPVDSSNDQVIFCGKEHLSHFLDSLAVVEHDKTLKTNGNVAWVVRKSSPMLAKRLDDWIAQNNSHFFDISQPKINQASDHRRYTAYISDDYFPEIPSFSDYPAGGYSSGGYGTYGNKPSDTSFSGYNYTNRKKGTFSYYDDLFIRYAPLAGVDWRLLAAIAYNESAFNPNATSPMGAMGLMQLMPSTARQYGAPNPYEPDQAVRAASKLLASLLQHYASVPDMSERINFALAAYNAGPGHVDDARRLAEKQGKDKNVWKDNVDEFVLYMSNPEYYNDPVVRHGYFRGGETYNYVNYVRSDWERFRK